MEIKNKTAADLESIARKIRVSTLETIYKAGSGHIGPSLSMVEILASLLFKELNWKDYLEDIRNKNHEEQWRYWHNPELRRDRFVLSKGHGVPSWYAALAVAGYLKPEELLTLRVMGSRLQGHPERKRFPFIDATTGSLGQGQSEALGYALAKKIAKRNEMVYCIIGDGESNEGQVWETAMAAAKFKLDNLVLIVDFNKKQGEGANKEIMDIEPLDHKWRAFSWHVQRIDGHNIEALLDSYEAARREKNRPHVIIADTRKGYLGNGEVFMDGAHNPTVNEENYNRAIKFLYGK